MKHKIVLLVKEGVQLFGILEVFYHKIIVLVTKSPLNLSPSDF